MVLGGDNCTVYALNIHSFTGSGMLLLGNDNELLGNYVGTDPTGNLAKPNGSFGVELHDASDNVIGGATEGDRNVISGGARDGVGIGGIYSEGNQIVGNYVGVDATGGRALPNALSGIRIHAGHGELIRDNVVSGNRNAGIELTGGTSDNRVEGNRVGTDASGTRAIPNGSFGVEIYDATNNLVGGDTRESRNVISGGARDGVGIDGIYSEGNQVVGNYVGVDATGRRALPNALSGIRIHAGQGELIRNNVVSGNRNAGIELTGGTSDNRVEGNRVGTDASGTRAIPNGSFGVEIYDATNNLVGGDTPESRNVISGGARDGVGIHGIYSEATKSSATMWGSTPPDGEPCPMR